MTRIRKDTQKSKHFAQACEQNRYKIKILITCRNNVLMKYKRRLCKTTVAQNYTEVRTISLLGD